MHEFNSNAHSRIDQMSQPAKLHFDTQHQVCQLDFPHNILPHV